MARIARAGTSCPALADLPSRISQILLRELRARRSLAPELLAEPSANVEQVGLRLGDSEPTAFIRAFKKWYGLTPGAYRRERP